MVKDLIMSKMGKKFVFEEGDKVKARALPASREKDMETRNCVYETLCPQPLDDLTDQI